MEPEDQEKEIEMQSEPLIINTQGGAVNSVNGKTGDVVLTTSDIENTSDYQTGAEVNSAINNAIEIEATARQNADNGLQSQIDAISASSDVTDIVGTYAELEDYDTSTLKDNDIIKVLQDENQNDETTYYRWSTSTNSFTLIGEEGPYYTKSQTDELLNDKQDTLTAGSGIDITNNVISSTGGSGPSVVQTTGTSTTDVMSQNATSFMVFADPGTDTKVKIGNNASSASNNSIAIGAGAEASGSGSFRSVVIGYNAGSSNQDSVALGASAKATGVGSFQTAIGRSANANNKGSVALGAYSNTSSQGEVNIGSTDTGFGYNNTAYRLLSGVHDPVDAHDAATKGYVDAQSGGGSGDTVYSDKTTSNSSDGGAVYIGNLDSSQQEQADPTTTDNHYKYFWALPDSNSRVPTDSSVNILGDCRSEMGIIIGKGAYDAQNTYYNTVIGGSASTGANVSSGIAIGFSAGDNANNGVAIGRGAKVAQTAHQNSVALGSFAQTSRKGEVNVGTGGYNSGFNNTDYRVIGGVHDGQQAHDAVTVEQVNATIDAINTAMGTSIPYIGA